VQGFYKLLYRKVFLIYATATWTFVIKISVFKREVISSFEACSRNNSIASCKLDFASSTVFPWLATSNSGQSATNPLFPLFSL
jgi:hypothetical protein